MRCFFNVPLVIPIYTASFCSKSTLALRRLLNVIHSFLVTAFVLDSKNAQICSFGYIFIHNSNDSSMT